MKKETIIMIIIIFLAIFSRIAFLNIRPLHSDESVNYFFAKNIISGKGFFYDPANYHGSFYFFILALSFAIFGISELSLRLPAAIFGILLAILSVLFKFQDKTFDKFGKYIASIFIIFSPSILYYSRYSIHESSFVFFTFPAIYFFTKILESKNLWHLPLLTASLAFLFAIKETAALLMPVFLILCIFNYRELKKIKQKKIILMTILSIFIFLLIYILFFTSFFTNQKGFSDSFKAYLPWTERGLNEINHGKPFYYYFLLLLQYEFPLLLLGIIGLFYSFKSKSIFFKNISIWFILIFLVYSLIPYKTPWLIINMTLPLCFLSGIGIGNLYAKSGPLKSKFIIIFLLITIIYLISVSFILSFIYPWQSKNKFAYAHTDKDIFNLVKEINQKADKNSKILIISKEYWPLPFYFDNMPVYYLDSKVPANYSQYLEDYDFIITDKKYFFESTKKPADFKSSRLREGIILYLMEKD